MNFPVAVVFLSFSILIIAGCVHSEENDGFLGNFGKPIIKIIQRTFQIEPQIPASPIIFPASIQKLWQPYMYSAQEHAYGMCYFIVLLAQYLNWPKKNLKFNVGTLGIET